MASLQVRADELAVGDEILRDARDPLTVTAIGRKTKRYVVVHTSGGAVQLERDGLLHVTARVL